MMFGSVIHIEAWEGKKPNEQLNCAIASCDGDFLETHGIQLAQGRFFDNAPSGSQSDKVVVNETAVRALGFDQPVGKHLDNREIIGVVKDFHARSLHAPIGPVALICNPARFEDLFIKLKSADPAVLESLTRAWNRIAPDYPFEFAFLDQRIDNLYRADQRLGSVVNVHAGGSVTSTGTNGTAGGLIAVNGAAVNQPEVFACFSASACPNNPTQISSSIPWVIAGWVRLTIRAAAVMPPEATTALSA